MTFRQFAYRNVSRNKRTYAAYFLSSAFSVMIFFICALFIFNPTIQQGLIFAVAVQAMIAAEVIMYIFSFFFVLYSVSSFLKTRKREFGILIMHGMTKGQLNRMVFLENMLIGLGAMLSGIAAGLLTGKLFLMVGSSFLGIPSIPFYLSWKSLILTVGSFTLLFLLISICTSVLARTNRLIELFQSAQKPKSEPKASIFLSLLAAILLIASYYLAATASATTVMIRMFPVIGMTIVGTYFFYTQLSIFIIRLLQHNRLFFWRKTNMLTLSSLAYRIKDNARMFFMVTIISTVAFCAVGAFASMNSLSKEFKSDYPAAISYLAKDGNQTAAKHLNDIKAELAEKEVNYQLLNIPIKYAAITSSSSTNQPEQLPLISFSDYKKSSLLAGFSFNEQPLSDNEALFILGSSRDRVLIGSIEKVSYTLEGNPNPIQVVGFTHHVAIPDYLLANFEAESGGIVVSDKRFSQIASSVQTDHFTGFYVDAFEQTEGMADHLADRGITRYGTEKPYAIVVSGSLSSTQKNMFSTMLFVALLVGTVFFIAAGSFLYFRLYADLDYDRHQYATLAKLGLTAQELTQIVSRQVSLLFFVPIGIALIHSIFAFMALQSLFYLSIASELGIVLISFIIAQAAYYFFIRNRYLRNLKKTLV